MRNHSEAHDAAQVECLAKQLKGAEDDGIVSSDELEGLF